MIINKQELIENLTNSQTPFYLYSKAELRKTVNEIREAFDDDNVQLLFATMANDQEEFLQTVNFLKVGACVNSILHVEKVLNCGFNKENIQFTSTGIPLNELEKLSKLKITVNVDSLSQLQHWFSLPNTSKAGIRINTGSLLGQGILNSDRLGIEIQDLPKALSIATNMGKIVNGLHIYVGTNYKSHEKMLVPLEAFFKTAASIETLEYVNIGGGIGVNYMNEIEEFDLLSFGEKVCSFRNELEKKLQKKIRLVFEPGRRFAASSGVFVTKVTDVKKLNGTRYVVVDASIAVFPRPFHHPDSPHKALVPFRSGEVSDAIVVGRTTFSRDILINTTLPNTISVGDVLIFDQAGAYCDSMRSRFLGQHEPKNIFIDN